MYVIKGHIMSTNNKGIQVTNLEILRSGGNITYAASYQTVPVSLIVLSHTTSNHSSRIYNQHYFRYTVINTKHLTCRIDSSGTSKFCSLFSPQSKSELLD